jgi:two-component system, cell cycle sensor histidine kinase and response regulator CckA
VLIASSDRTDLAQRLHEIRADLPVILTTGTTDPFLPDRLRAVGIRQLLPKPFSVQALAEAVHRVLVRISPNA